MKSSRPYFPLITTSFSTSEWSREIDVYRVFASRLEPTTWPRRSSQEYVLEMNSLLKGHRQILGPLSNLPAIFVHNVGLWAPPGRRVLFVKWRGWATHILWPLLILICHEFGILENICWVPRERTTEEHGIRNWVWESTLLDGVRWWGRENTLIHDLSNDYKWVL